MRTAAVANSRVWCKVVKTNPPTYEGEKNALKKDGHSKKRCRPCVNQLSTRRLRNPGADREQGFFGVGSARTGGKIHGGQMAFVRQSVVTKAREDQAWG
ncbi:MAG: hypothetical protein JWO19_2267 [Bryobacterales bacterium]|nr:hypothetical protein [Bryobacterales bacterium]